MKNPIIDAVLAEEAGAELELFSARDEASKRLAAAQEEAKRQLEMARALRDLGYLRNEGYTAVRDMGSGCVFSAITLRRFPRFLVSRVQVLVWGETGTTRPPRCPGIPKGCGQRG